MAKYNKLIVAVFIAFAIIYLGQSIFVAPDPEVIKKYNLNAVQLRLITLSVVIPYVIIWVIAIIGYLRLANYTTAIEKSKDGKAFKLITMGILALSIWLPVNTLLTSIIKYVSHTHPSLTDTAVIISNYTSLLLFFAGFLLVNEGSNY